MVLLKPCPKFPKLFRAISPMAVPPWFDICPYHEVLLSPGLVPPPQLGGATSSPSRPSARSLQTLPLSVAHENTGELRPLHSRHPHPLTGSPVAASVPAPHSPPNPPAGEIQAATADSWSGWLIWLRGGSEVYTRVQATDLVRNPRTSTWPTTLRLRIVEAGVSTLEIQEWIRKNKASTAVIKCADETDNPDFDELVKLVRKGGGYAIVQWELQGKLTSLLLAPISKGLLCAAFPTTTMPAPPTRSQQPQQAALPQADQHPPANIPPAMLRQVQYLQGNLGGHQTNGLATGALVQPTRMSRQQFQMLQQQGVFMQIPPPPPLLTAQQDHQYQQQGSVDAQSALTPSGGLVPGGGPVMTTDNVGGGAGIGSAGANPAQWGMNGGLYEGAIDSDEAELGMMPSPTDGAMQDAEMMFQLYTNKYD
ncbi:hypothetical protein BC826DRAFT_369694 [Russula brevipes]|nr:hypothetical protein BC826DRAFT_369694 [Russula brevipes]